MVQQAEPLQEDFALLAGQDVLPLPQELEGADPICSSRRLAIKTASGAEISSRRALIGDPFFSLCFKQLNWEPVVPASRECWSVERLPLAWQMAAFPDSLSSFFVQAFIWPQAN